MASAGLCVECGRKAPRVDDLALLDWKGGMELHFDIVGEDIVTLICPDCVQRLESKSPGAA